MANMRKNAAANGDTGKETVETTTVAETTNGDEGLRAMVLQQQDQIRQLTELIRKTTDTNKLRQYERELKEFEGFAFSLKLFPTDEGELRVVTKWKLHKDHVADQGRIVNQRLKVWYDDEGEEKVEEMELVDFVRVLKRSGPLLAKKLENEDGSEVSIDFRVNEETKKTNAFMRPKTGNFVATIEYGGKDYRISSQYLNA